MAANSQAKPSPTRMQVLLRPEDAAHLESLREQYRARHGVPLRRPDAVRLALAWAARTWGAAGPARTGEDDS
ncbi:MAG: hypothetical protein OXE86_09420 [Alphaproteobacteria bacterium]|nr:hypothetical protein [Alphaproteobacteria bacterium]